jgi:RimJ/RimL family protein N-acetyltransferase
MIKDWLAPPNGRAASLAMAIADAVPVIATPRLRLRAPVLGDFPAYAEVFTSERAQYMGGPFTGEEAFADFCQGIAGWMLRGAGMWTVTLARADVPLGWLYLWKEWGGPEPELGWVLTLAAEGRGYAREAAFAVLPHALALYGPSGFVSYIDAGNIRSARLAAALGAARDIAAEAQMAAQGEPDLQVWRHSGTGRAE